MLAAFLLASLPSYTVYRAAEPPKLDGKLDEPAWFVAPALKLREFPWFQSGRKEETVVKLLWDDTNLYIALIAEDAHITARHTERDGKIPEDDCFEIMVAPDAAKPDVYYNLEWNVIGGLVDNFRPNGPKQPRAPKWDAEGVRIVGSYSGTLNQDQDRDRHWTVEVAIPLRNFGATPKPGSHWNANFNRHGGAVNPQYSQWSAGDTPKPSFHTPHRFGKLVFSADRRPF
ncbi:MAG: hypothetical protein FJW39_17010 [Acidobacteria bacterium]|nr:hypothetical protein [Acidobacteriota bacterium]